MTHIEEEPNPAVARRYHERIAHNEKELETLEAKIREATDHLKGPNVPPKREELLAMLDDLWPLLEKADPGEVAPVLRAITGPIRISQREVPG
jgi:hypothetical protein